MPAKLNARLRNKKFERNINKRGNVPVREKQDGSRLGPVVIGVLLFVVVGSALFQVIKMATSGGL
eukprot:CAMPEP_0205824446 /NCGR_PEP_ID=MMETSP0206-20130828/21072_1 /ASSEMBLY_ACC=CAM_ASM_000279 /TAXON_ID=36767 /ORGANISM="Euplotes focardii, Strain TN1" /LENGTH=64 /DNA_ID=CAMNT_0053122601 /DNA_START=29 /DNA_END=223 /DNA_ORIENTATION=-